MIPLGVLSSRRAAASGDPLALYAHWAMDEGSGPTTTDSVGAVTATLPASSRWVAGLDGTAVQVDPANSLKSAVASWPAHTWDKLVVEWRMRLDSGSGDTMVLGVGSSDVIGFWLSATAVKAWCYVSGVNVGNTSTSLVTTLGDWHTWRIEVTPGDSLVVRRDGAVVASYPARSGYIGRTHTNLTVAYVAGSPWASTPGQTVDDWKLYGPS